MQTKKAVIYCRVSTKEQVEEGNSLATQEKVCRQYALTHGYEIIETFIEPGESAKTTDRAELQKLLRFCTNRGHGVNAVITYKIDRISRNSYDYADIRIILKKYGIEIKSTSESFSDDPAGRFMENIIANVAQFDNDVRTERCSNGMKEAVREGRYVWSAPLGYSNVRIGGKATIQANNLAPIVRETFLKVAQNLNPAELIRQKMGERGLLMPSGKKMSKAQFYKMLRNPLYAGWTVKFGETHKGLFEPIVSQEIFEQVQRILSSKRARHYTYKLKHPDFPLRRFFKHPSGRLLSGCWSKGKQKKYAYYLFKEPSLVIPKAKLESYFVELLNQFSLNNDLFIKLTKQVREHLVKSNQENHSTGIRLKSYIKELKEKQSHLIQKNIEGIISNSLLKEQLHIIDGELLKVNSHLLTLPDTMVYYDELLTKLKEFVVSPGKLWLEMPFETKLKLQWFYFPKGIVFDGIKSKTPETCRIFNVKSFIPTNNSHVVDSKAPKLNSPHITTESFWKDIGQEIIDLADMISDP